MSSRAMLDALPAWGEWRQAICDAVLASSEAKLDKALRRWAEEATTDAALTASPIARGLREATLHADLGGQLFVRTIEVPESGQRANAADGAGPGPSGDGAGPNPFLSLRFEEALRYFLSRGIVTPEEFAALDDDARLRAFTATRLASDELIARCHELLAETIRDGGTYDDFARDLNRGALSLGIEPESPAYLETVYRTNVAGAYGAGRYRQLTSSTVRSVRPYIEYRTANDSRVRPNHAALHGVVFSQDDAGWHRYAPPLGFSCRCSIIARRAEDVDLSRVVNSADLTVEPDEGFSGVPRLAP